MGGIWGGDRGGWVWHHHFLGIITCYFSQIDRLLSFPLYRLGNRLPIKKASWLRAGNLYQASPTSRPMFSTGTVSWAWEGGKAQGGPGTGPGPPGGGAPFSLPGVCPVPTAVPQQAMAPGSCVGGLGACCPKTGVKKHSQASPCKPTFLDPRPHVLPCLMLVMMNLCVICSVFTLCRVLHKLCHHF